MGAKIAKGSKRLVSTENGEVDDEELGDKAAGGPAAAATELVQAGTLDKLSSPTRQTYAIGLQALHLSYVFESHTLVHFIAVSRVSLDVFKAFRMKHCWANRRAGLVSSFFLAHGLFNHCECPCQGPIMA